METVTFEVQEYPLTTAFTNSLSEEKKAMFSALCVAVSEIQALRKILLLGPQKPIFVAEIDQIFLSQKLFFIRLMSSKLYEIFKTIRGSGVQNECSELEVSEFQKKVGNQAYNRIKKLNGFDLATKVRKKASFHYDLDQFKKDIVPNGFLRDSTIFFSPSNNNKFFPFGEDSLMISFFGNSKGNDLSEENFLKEIATNFQLLCEFTVHALNELMNVMTCFVDQFIIEENEDGTSRMKSRELHVPSTLVGESGVDAFPLFIKKSG